ncbi:CDP-glycerol--glycerophosphate glycerophosphotransferase [Kitasatospora sp. MMS16-BH015]|uniref:bifunctional glycosyltransferase/CDP-glycerol:glycerophosphate glycerophosphotransferase n=1 Tax=Kitasatospora sp. MMS16-BH015 TaxID=2018025 RepID=UPI000CA37669|nr:bifunctional glycosyltransferase family 2 protein/CDP-glycerol:glycerophosphate glycerophosphotransferase [Kitasatospora sp. MMS16-BH015]AUG77847.1 CDP-glycerol--glycerophosphate glycerophosphotransferase [Kitasatospora sp. MMS16-BH015]
MPSSQPDPLVSVVVIVYNDAVRLPRAVRSALTQSLRGVEVLIVDDRSTDDSFAVAERLAEGDARVRAFRLAENSGGCGAPRNRGVAEARGRYVMFLDSDDELDPHACRNLYEAGERTGAELVSGLSVRRFLGSRHGKTDAWYPWIYRRTRTLDSITELPDLLVWDTLSTNKAYRREFLLRAGLEFPVGILYEDLLFSAQAYLAAERITLIPNRVYWWDVAAPAKGSERSLSNRRHEIRNFTDRLEIHRRIDAMLADRGMVELKYRKDVKFLKHDLVLHLRDLPFLPESFRAEFAEHARAYLAGLDPEAVAETPAIQRICAYLLARDDWAELLPAIDTLINRDKLSSPLAERDGRVYWTGRHLDDPEGRRVLDVTEAGYHAAPLGTLFLRNQLTRYALGPYGVELAGRVVNPLGRIPAGARLAARLEFTARRGGLQTFAFPVAEVRHEGEGIHWRGRADLAKRLRPLGVVDGVWDVRLVLTVDGERTVSRITVGSYDLAGAEASRVRPRLTRLTGDRLRPERSDRDHLTFELAAESAPARRATDLLDRAVRGEAGALANAAAERARRTVRGGLKLKRKLADGDTKLKVYHQVLQKLPVVKGQVVFESHQGKQYSDNPRAVYEELARRGAPMTAVWSYARSAEGFPSGAKLVRRWSWEYLRALAQAEYWVDNQGYPYRLRKRPETTYIQTWHGSALKKMGYDLASLKRQSPARQAEYQAGLDRFDHFVVRSEHDVRTLAPAYRITERQLLRTGYPRNDALVREGAAKDRQLAGELGIDLSRPVVLYAPTFRSDGAGVARPFELPFDVERFAERFGDRLTLLVRCHYLDKVVLPPSVRGRVIDVSQVQEVTPLYLLSDALITDYSSLMFDYALLDRPMLFFAYDWEEYAESTRGTYFDLLREAPGPVLRDAERLFEALEELDAVEKEYAEERRRFVAEYGEYDRGDAAARIADLMFPRTGRTEEGR